MVMFRDRIAYSTAQRRGRIQQQILEQLTAGGTPVDLALADALIQERLEPA
jgi:hypothetical protein